MKFVYVTAVNLGKTGSYVDHIQGILDASFYQEDFIYLVYPRSSKFTLEIGENIKRIPLGLGNSYLVNSLLFDWFLSLWLLFQCPEKLSKVVIRPSFLMLFSFITSRFLKKYVQKEVNGIYNHELRLNRKFLHARISILIEKMTNYLSNEVLCVSEGIRNYYCSCRKNHKYFVVSNGVSDKYLSCYLNKRYVSGKLKLVFVGSLAPWQGLLEFIDYAAGRELFEKKVEFYVVGGGSLYNIVKKRLESSKINYTMTGHIEPNLIPDFLAKMDVAIIPRDPSLNINGSPLKLFVYAALGLPIVSTRIDGVVNEHKIAQECLFFDYSSWDTLHDILEGILGGEIDLNHVGEKMRMIIKNYYTWNHVYKKQFYENIDIDQ